MKERLEYIDMSRGLALLLVMVSHNGGVPFGGYYLMSYYIAVFFILSGLTYYPNKNKAIKKRFNQIIIPYFCYSGFLLIVSFFVMILKNDFSTRRIAQSIVGIIYSRNQIFPDGDIYMNIWNAPLWFLTAFFLSFCLLEYITQLEGMKKFRIEIICILLVVWYLFNKIPVLLPWSLDNVPIFVIFIYTAYWLKKPMEKVVGNMGQKVLIMLVSSVIYVIACNLNKGINLSLRNYGDYTGNDFVKAILLFVICFLGSVLLILLMSIIEKNITANKILSFVGKNTIDYLAIHLLILDMVKCLLKLVGMEATEGILFWIIVAIQDIIMILCSTVWVLMKRKIKNGVCRNL